MFYYHAMISFTGNIEIQEIGRLKYSDSISQVESYLQMTRADFRIILASLSVTPSSQIQAGEALGNDFLINLFRAAEVEISQVKLAPVVYIPKDEKTHLEQMVRSKVIPDSFGTQDVKGVYDSLRNSLIVFLDEDSCPFNTSLIAVHEKIHSIQRRAIVDNAEKKMTTLRRRGFSTGNKTNHIGDFLEEAFTSYTTIKYKEHLLLQQGSLWKEQIDTYYGILRFLQKTGKVDSQNRMYFYNKFKIPFLYYDYIVDGSHIKEVYINKSNLAGYFFELMLKKDANPDDLFTLALRARVDKKENQQFFKRLQNVLGPELLSNILRIQPGTPDILNLMTSLCL